MDMNSNQTTNGTTTNTSSGSSRPPSWVWVLVGLASALTIGIILFGVYQLIIRRRIRRRGGAEPGDSDAVSRGGGSTRLGGSLPLWARRRRPRSSTRSQPASRWGWVYPHHTNRASAQSSEGLNELGEAPPPYNEDDLEPCPQHVDMAEVHALGLGLGEAPSRVASRQDREPPGGLTGGQGHPEPPAYDFAVNLGGVGSVQQPAPAVVSEPRVA